MAKTVATILGIVFLVLGVAGFVIPNLLGTHLSLTHTIIHLTTGAVALWLGLKGSLGAARMFCIIFGAVYLLLGIAGFAAGSNSEPSAGVPGPADARLMKVIPGALELGTMDHVVHVLLGAVFLVGGFMTRSEVDRRPVAG